MNNFNLGEILTKSWKIIWKHKILWLFGIFAGCGSSGSNANFNSGSSGGSGGGPGSEFSGLPPRLESGLEELVRRMQDASFVFALVAALCAVVCIIALIQWVLRIYGRVGLIRGTLLADAGAERLGFGELWRAGHPFFWRLFLLDLLASIPIIAFVLLILILGLAAVLGTEGYGSVGAAEPIFGAIAISAFLLCCCLIPISLVTAVLVAVAQLAMVIEDLPLMDSVRRGWEVLKQNIGPFILLFIVLAVIGFAAGLILIVPVLLTVVPTMLAFAAALGGRGDFDFTPLIIAGICLLVYAPFLLVGQGILMAFSNSAWVLTWKSLTAPSAPADGIIAPQDALPSGNG